MATNEQAPGDLLEEELAGLDALDALRVEEGPGIATRLWVAAWPKLAAVAIFLFVWQVIVWTHWKPEYVIPSPWTALGELGSRAQTSEFWVAMKTTLRRAVVGYGVALVLGTALGVALTQSSVLRRAIGSMLTGLQSMPSIVWFPFAIIVFGLSESAILFVVVLGAFPSIANGLVSGVGQIPPLLLRAGRVMGARGASALRHVVLPAALPGYIAGLKQGWAFAWRSLMAGELLVFLEGRFSIGGDLHNAQDVSDMPRMLALMMVIFVIGIVVDGLFFETIERRIRRRRGLIEVGANG